MNDATRKPGGWLLIVAFAVALAFTGVYAVRSARDYLYWQQHADEPIQPWMTIGFVAHSYHVPPHILHIALGIPIQPRDHRPLSRIAASRGITFAQAEARLHDAIVHVRPPYPPPAPPPPESKATAR